MGIEKKVYSFRFSEDMVDRLRACAEAENRTLSNMIETILLQYLSKRDEETKKCPYALGAGGHPFAFFPTIRYGRAGPER